MNTQIGNGSVRRARPNLFLVSTALLLPLSALFAHAATKQYIVTKDTTAMGIAAAAISAMGGTQALLTYQDSQASGTLTVYAVKPPDKFPITMKSKTTKETRIELQKPNGTSIRVLNNGQAAIQKPDGRVKHLLMNNTIGERVTNIPLLSLLAEYQDPHVQLGYRGIAKVNGQDTDVITVSFVPSTDSVQGPAFAAMTQTAFYVNRATHLVDKVESKNYAENNASDAETLDTFYTQYRPVDGILVPFHIATYGDGVLQEEIDLSIVAFNVGLADSDFTLPQ